MNTLNKEGKERMRGSEDDNFKMRNIGTGTSYKGE